MEAVISSPALSVGGIELDALYREQVVYVWATLRRLGVAPDDLEDVAHEVFVVVHRRRRDFDATRPVRPWIFGITLRAASRYRRSARRRREVSDSEIEITDGARGAEGAIEQRDARRLVFEALDRLTEDQRVVFVLHELEGRAAPDIASELAVPLNTIYSRLRLARERFTSAVTRLRTKEVAR